MSARRNGMRCSTAALHPRMRRGDSGGRSAPSPTVAAMPPQEQVPTPAPAQSAIPRSVDSPGSAPSTVVTALRSRPSGSSAANAVVLAPSTRVRHMWLEEPCNADIAYVGELDSAWLQQNCRGVAGLHLRWT